MMTIKLNNFISNEHDSGFILKPEEEYEINVDDELDSQVVIMKSFQVMGSPPALKNYHEWLFKNNFNIEMPNPTNVCVADYYGKAPLWKTDYSQGIVVKNVNDDDYYIVMECSEKNKGYKHTMIILTLGGCV